MAVRQEVVLVAVAHWFELAYGSVETSFNRKKLENVRLMSILPEEWQDKNMQ